MELRNDSLKIERNLSELDKQVIDFTGKLEDLGVEYVVVSGYVAVLAGRSRGTEGVDIILEDMDEESTERVGSELKENGYWCINSAISEIHEMLEDDLAVRFAEEGKAIPNFEVRFASDLFERDALTERLKVELDSDKLWISPLELQAAYKLYLGSEKDMEDALYLYKLFEEELDEDKLENYAEKLEVGGRLNELKES